MSVVTIVSFRFDAIFEIPNVVLLEMIGSDGASMGILLSRAVMDIRICLQAPHT
jgi:hypothetical protein